MVQKFTFVEGSLDEVVARFSSNDTFGLDLETTGLNPVDSRIILCQIGFRKDGTYVIDTSRVDIEPLIPYFVSTKWRKIIQNSAFERKFIRKYLGSRITNVFDPMLAEQILTTNEKYASVSLETLARKYAGMTLNKKVRKGFEGRGDAMFTEEELDYAADDVICLFPIMDAQNKLLEGINSLHIAELEFDVAQVTADMELEGIPVLTDKWRKILDDIKIKHEESRLKLNGLLLDNGTEQLGMFVRDGIDLNSPLKVKQAFWNIGLEVADTNERTISLIDHPAAKELLQYREYQKAITSYDTSFLYKIHPFSGRIHAEFKQMGTDTGRYSCEKPNLQQIPDQFRQCIGDKEHVIIAADYSQMELRILAELSRDENLINAFTSGADLHKATAALMFGVPIDKVTKEQRFIGKTLNFGIAYGMGSKKLRDTLNAEAIKNGTKTYSIMQTNSLMAKYKTAYKDAVKWLNQTGDLAFRRGYSETMFGRRRYYNRPAQGISQEDYELQVGGIKRQGANSPIQGTNADITKLAMIEIGNELENYRFSGKIIIQVHDEVVILARREEAESIKIIAVDAMVSAAQRFLTTVPVKVEAYISDVWKKG